MKLDTYFGIPIDAELLVNYFKTLVNLFFKILPIREAEDPTLETYMCSLRNELLGCREVVVAIHNNAGFLSLISILQYLIENPDCSVRDVKREVFKAISICNRLAACYGENTEVGDGRVE